MPAIRRWPAATLRPPRPSGTAATVMVVLATLAIAAGTVLFVLLRSQSHGDGPRSNVATSRASAAGRDAPSDSSKRPAPWADGQRTTTTTPIERTVTTTTSASPTPPPRPPLPPCDVSSYDDLSPTSAPSKSDDDDDGDWWSIALRRQVLPAIAVAPAAVPSHHRRTAAEGDANGRGTEEIPSDVNVAATAGGYRPEWMRRVNATWARRDIVEEPWLPFAHCYCSDPATIAGGCGLLLHRVAVSYSTRDGPANVSFELSERELMDAAAAAANSKTSQSGAAKERRGSNTSNRSMKEGFDADVVMELRRRRGVAALLRRVYARLYFGLLACSSNQRIMHEAFDASTKFPTYQLLRTCHARPGPVQRFGVATSDLELKEEDQRNVAGNHHQPPPVSQRWLPFTQVSYNRWLTYQQYHGIFEWHGLTWLIWGMQAGMAEIRKIAPALLRRMKPASQPRGDRREGSLLDVGEGQQRSPFDLHDVTTFVDGLPTAKGTATVLELNRATLGYEMTRLMRLPNFTIRSSAPPPKGTHHGPDMVPRNGSTAARVGGPAVSSFLHISYWHVPLQGTEAYWRAVLRWSTSLRQRLPLVYPEIYGHTRRDAAASHHQNVTAGGEGGVSKDGTNGADGGDEEEATSYSLIGGQPLNQPPLPTFLYDYRPRVHDEPRGRMRGIHIDDEPVLLDTLSRSGFGLPMKTALYSTTMTFREQLRIVRSYQYFLQGEGAFNMWMLFARPRSTFVVYYDNLFDRDGHLENVFVWVFNYSMNVWRLTKDIRMIAVTREKGIMADMALLERVLTTRPFRAEVIWLKPGKQDVIDLTPPRVTAANFQFRDLPLVETLGTTRT